MEIHRNTISAWMTGKNTPRRRDLRLFAEVTGVPIEWLEESRPRESNPRPSHYKSDPWGLGFGYLVAFALIRQAVRS